jgi:hypothetical protein
MIELQWVKRKKVYVDEYTEFPFTENVLQYRESVEDDYGNFLYYTEWTDVPVVEENVQN